MYENVTDSYDKIGGEDKGENENKASVDVEDEAEFLRIARKRFDLALVSEKDNRDRYKDDIKFATTGDQWPDEVKKMRGENRPALTVNKLNGVLKQIRGNYRLNEMSVKVRPANDNADIQIAEIYDGLIRNIEIQSRAKIAYNTAYDCATGGGRGYWRIVTEYSNDDGFEQDIRIKRITNPLTVYCDPKAQELDRSDARYYFITEMISRDDFRELYPKINPSDFESSENDYAHWYEQDSVRIAEYWIKKPLKKRIAELSDGTVVNLDDEGVEDVLKLLANPAPQQDPLTGQSIPVEPIVVVKEREVEYEQVYFYKICGHAILEEGEWAGKYIPIVPVFGEEVDLEGKLLTYGAVHHAKDAQRMYNYWKTTATEAIALAPKAPYLLTPDQIAGFDQQWRDANTVNYPYLLYNPTPQGVPQRATPPIMPTAEINMAMGAADDIKATTGIYDASLGANGNEQSGKAIRARQMQSESATTTFVDNMTLAMEYSGLILVDLIPRIYDSERIVRIVGIDNNTKMVPINKVARDPQGNEIIINDLSQGKYDVTVTTGPSYATKRMEAVESMLEFMRVVPQQGALISDVVVKNMDWPGAQEIQQRLRRAIPPQIVGPSDDPQERAQQAQQAMQQQQQQQAILAIQQQKIQSDQQLEMMKEQTQRMKIMAEQQRTQVDMAELQLDSQEMNLKHQALQSGAMAPPPYLTPRR